jgi:hypothetical protein
MAKKIACLVLATFQITSVAFAGTNYEQLRKTDPVLAAELEKIDLDGAKEQIEISRKFNRLTANTEKLSKMAIYLSNKGNWLFDVEISRMWLVPSLVALAGIYGHMRHAEILNNPYSKEFETVANLSNRQKFLSVFASAGIIGAIAFIASEVKINRDLKELDSSSPDEVVRKYKELLCETHELSLELKMGGIYDNVNHQAPVCP